MAHYLIQIVYESEKTLGWSALLRPVSRMRVEIEKRGGKVRVAGLTTGQNHPELVAVCLMPDAGSMTATARAINALATNSIKTIRIAPLVLLIDGNEEPLSEGVPHA